MIFSAGMGTRFKPWTDKHPKALAIVNGKSLLQRNIEYLQHYNINSVVVNVHHFADQVLKAIEENKGWGSEIIISDEREMLLETGGGLWHAKHLLNNEPFLTLNVDFLTTLDLHKFIVSHEISSSPISIAVTNRISSRSFLFDEDMRLCGWRNAQTGEERISFEKSNLKSYSYSCVAAYAPQVFDLMKHRGKFSIVETFLDVAKTHKVSGYDHTGDATVDVGKPESVAVAEKLFF